MIGVSSLWAARRRSRADLPPSGVMASASQTRIGRVTQPPELFANEQQNRTLRIEEERRRARRGARRVENGEQQAALAHQQMDAVIDAVAVQAEEEEVDRDGEEAEEAEIEEDEEQGRNDDDEEEEQQNADGDEEFGNLAERMEAEVPGPRETQPGEDWQDGWHMIDKLGAQECFSCIFSTVQDVPGDFQMIWTQAWAVVLRREAEAETSLAKERALKWLCFLSQGLLRTPRRGAKAGRGAIAKRFRAVVQGDWGSLVTMWQSDVARAEEREQRRAGRRRTR